jgi:hypothetical protein
MHGVQTAGTKLRLCWQNSSTSRAELAARTAAQAVICCGHSAICFANSYFAIDSLHKIGYIAAAPQGVKSNDL